jgi:hypothetical protein
VHHGSLQQSNCENLDSLLLQEGCRNHVEIKAWGRPHPGDVAMEGATLSSSNGTRARASRAADVCVAHHPWDHQGLPLPHLSLQALHDLPPVRDDTEYEKLLAEPEGREMALRAKDQSVEAEAAQAKLGEAKLQQETEDEEAEAVRKSLGERGAAIAMAKAMERA